MKDIRPKNDAGLTLIGVLVALFVLVVSILAATQLMARTEHITSISRERFVATNLAREGLELVQWVRDSNWMNGKDWTSQLCSEGQEDNKFTIVRNSDVGANIVEWSSGRNNGDLYLTTAGEYNYDKTDKGISLFNRTITVDCREKKNDPAFITVTSTVTWGDGSKSVVLKDRLYNWY